MHLQELLVHLNCARTAYDSYLALGEDVKARVGADVNLLKMRALIRARQTAGLPLQSEDKENFTNKAAISDLERKVNDAIAAHGSVYLATHEPALTSATNDVKPFHRGAKDGQSWKANMDANIGRDGLLATAGQTVLALPKETFIPPIYKLSQDLQRLLLLLLQIRRVSFRLDLNAIGVVALCQAP